MDLTSGDSQLPGIFQEPEAVITTSVDPKKITESKNVIEEKKNVEGTVEQEKKGWCLLSISLCLCVLS